MIASIKQCYWADLRSLADDHDNIIGLQKINDGVGCYIQHISGMVFCESSNTSLIMEEMSSRSRRR
jgi:hypothetical protein